MNQPVRFWPVRIKHSTALLDKRWDKLFCLRRDPSSDPKPTETHIFYICPLCHIWKGDILNMRAFAPLVPSWAYCQQWETVEEEECYSSSLASSIFFFLMRMWGLQEQIEFREQEEKDGYSEEGKQTWGGGGARNGKGEKEGERRWRSEVWQNEGSGNFSLSIIHPL